MCRRSAYRIRPTKKLKFSMRSPGWWETGKAKSKAIRGALNGKLLDVLVTDHVTATWLSKQSV